MNIDCPELGFNGLRDSGIVFEKHSYVTIDVILCDELALKTIP